MTMTSNRPYLVRALYQWILDNDCTPHLLVNALLDGVEVPRRHVVDGKIVLNLAPRAVRDLLLADAEITFSARFGGQPMNLRVPMAAVAGIYAQENGAGMMFPAEDPVPPPTDTEPTDTGPTNSSVDKKARLRVVK